MVSRENRVLLVTTSLAALLLVAAAVARVDAVGPGMLAFVGVGVLAPQLYLAATDDSVPARTRVRAGVLVSVALLAGTYGTAPAGERTLVGAATAALLVGLVACEVYAGYREATAGA